MGNGNLTRLLLQKISTRKFHFVPKREASADVPPSNWCASLEKKLEKEPPGESKSVCIYKVPPTMRRVEKKAFEPNIISIGPYHHGAPRLQTMEDLKWRYVHRLFNPKQQHRLELKPVRDAMEKLEEKARSCYSDKVELSRDQFLKMMLIDGCFIIQLFREVAEQEKMQQKLVEECPFIKRWMLPNLRRDLIMLENQLPLFVLSELFHLITTCSSPSLQKLALGFFNPLMQRDSDTQEGNRLSSGWKKLVFGPPKENTIMEGIEGEHLHLLDLFRSSILPENLSRGKQTQMIHSIKELKEAGIKITADETRRPLDISFGKWKPYIFMGKKLTIPPLHIDDHRGTLFHNMVAYEKCHQDCYPDVTTFLFFFDGLINSGDDVGLLHYKGVLHHSLGRNKEVAKLVNSLCKEVVPDVDESYLHMVVNDANYYFHGRYAKVRARLAHHYFSSWLVGVSTIGAIFALYLSLIQTASGVAASLDSLHQNHFWSYLKDTITLPVAGKPSTTTSTEKTPSPGEENF